MSFFQKHKKTTKAITIFVTILVVFQTMLPVFLFWPKTVHAQYFTTDVTDILGDWSRYQAVTAKETAEKTTDTILERIFKGLILSVALTIRNLGVYITRIAATQLVTYSLEGGIGGEKPFYDQIVGKFKSDIMEYTVGRLIDNIRQILLEELGFDICDPSLPIKLRFQFGLAVKDQERDKPDCSWSKLSKTWGDLYDKVVGGVMDFFRDPEAMLLAGSIALLERMQDLSMKPMTSDIGVGMILEDQLRLQRQDAQYSELKQREEDQGSKSKKNTLGFNIETPGFMTRGYIMNEQGAIQESGGKGEIAAAQHAMSDIPAAIAGALLNTLISEYIKQGLVKLLLMGVSKDEEDYRPPTGSWGIGYSDPARRQQRARDVVFSKAERANLSFNPKEIDFLTQFTNCPEDRQMYNCVMDHSFAQAVRLATQDEPITVQEAIALGYLDGDKPFIHKDDERNRDNDCYELGYCYSNLVKLRMARIVPVGWEIAATISKVKDNVITLNYLIDNFKRDSQNFSDADFLGLVDPNWVLKAPKAKCEAEGYGVNLLAPEVNERQKYCADIKNCIATDEGGDCRAWGYCAAEKNVWKFNADECTPQYDSCRTFKIRGEGKQYSYLLNTVNRNLEGPDCSVSNAGCSWYTTGMIKANTSEQGQDPIYEWRWSSEEQSFPFDNFDKSIIRLDRDIEGRTCDSQSEGCTRFIRTGPDLGSNLVKNGGFESVSMLDIENFSGQVPDHISCPNREASACQLDSRSFEGEKSALLVGTSNIELITERILSIVPQKNKKYYALSAYVNKRRSDNSTIEITYDSNSEFDNPDDLVINDIESMSYNGSATADMEPEQWNRIYTIFEVNPDGQITNDQPSLNVSVDVSPGGEFLIDNIMLEEISLPSRNLMNDYAEYGEENINKITYLKKAPQTLGCYDVTGSSPYARPIKRSQIDESNDALSTDRGPAQRGCDTFAKLCSAEEVGCDAFEPTDEGETVFGSISFSDFCPSVCAGYQSYKKQNSFYEDEEFPVHLIPANAQTCTAADVGCDEFTNLDVLGAGGEAREYYKQLKHCARLPERQADCKNFYTWVSSESEGYKLEAYLLQDSDEQPGPDVIDEESIYECNEYVFSTRENPECNQYYDEAGNAYYALSSQVITCSENCRPYRRTIQYEDDGETAANKCARRQGIWQSETNDCVFMAIPEEGQTCSETSAGCREYKGNFAGDEEILYYTTFADWQGEDEEITLDGQVETTEGFGAIAIVNADDPYDVASGNNADQGQIITKTADINFTMYGPGEYRVSFWANTNTSEVTESLKLRVLVSDDNNTYYESEPSSVPAGSTWTYHTFNFTVDANFNGDEYLGILANRTWEYKIDNFKITKVSDIEYLIKDSWTIPAVCDNELAYNPVDEDDRRMPQAMIGCREYEDPEGSLYYLKSFSELCSEDVVGCEMVIDTRNTKTAKEMVIDVDDGNVVNYFTYNDPIEKLAPKQYVAVKKLENTEDKLTQGLYQISAVEQSIEDEPSFAEATEDEPEAYYKISATYGEACGGHYQCPTDSCCAGGVCNDPSEHTCCFGDEYCGMLDQGRCGQGDNRYICEYDEPQDPLDHECDDDSDCVGIGNSQCVTELIPARCGGAASDVLCNHDNDCAEGQVCSSGGICLQEQTYIQFVNPWLFDPIYVDIDEEEEEDDDEEQIAMSTPNVRFQNDYVMYLVVDEDIKCPASQKGCTLLGKPELTSTYKDQTRFIPEENPSPGGIQGRFEYLGVSVEEVVKMKDGKPVYNNFYYIIDPDTIAAEPSPLCRKVEENCEEWVTDKGDTYYFKKPNDKLCEFREGYVKEMDQTMFAWFRKVSADEEQQFEREYGLTESLGDVLCETQDYYYDGVDHLIRNTDNSNWVSIIGDDSYNGWVGECPRKESGCTAFIDPTDKQKAGNSAKNERGKPYYYKDNDNLDRTSCTEVDRSQGCVLFSNTGDFISDPEVQGGYYGQVNSDWSAFNTYAEVRGYDRPSAPITQTHEFGCSDNYYDAWLKSAPKYCGGTVESGKECVNRVDCRGLENEYDGSECNPIATNIYCKEMEKCLLVYNYNTQEANNGYVETCLQKLRDHDRIQTGEPDEPYEYVCTTEETINDITVMEMNARCTARHLMKNDTNEIIKVVHDRECASWYDCRVKHYNWDPEKSQYTEVCDMVGLCTELTKESNDARCGHWIQMEFPRNLLSYNRPFREGNYKSRGTSWFDIDYSGLTIVGIPPLQHVTAYDINQGLKKCGGTGRTCDDIDDCNDCMPAEPEYHLVNYQAGISCQEDSDCADFCPGYSNSEYKCRCVTNVCVRALNPGRKFGQSDVSDSPMCRVYPAVDSPFPARLADESQAGRKYKSVNTVSTDRIASDSDCNLDTDYGCYYRELKYGPGGAITKYLPQQGGCYPRAVDNGGNQGYCADEPDKVCTCDAELAPMTEPVASDYCEGDDDDCIAYRDAKQVYNEHERKRNAYQNTKQMCTSDDCDGNTCYKLEDNGIEYTGLGGYCLQSDETTNIYNEDNNHPCLLWYPSDVLAGLKDLSGNAEDAGYSNWGTDIWGAQPISAGDGDPLFCLDATRWEKRWMFVKRTDGAMNCSSGDDVKNPYGYFVPTACDGDGFQEPGGTDELKAECNDYGYSTSRLWYKTSCGDNTAKSYRDAPGDTKIQSKYGHYVADAIDAHNHRYDRYGPGGDREGQCLEPARLNQINDVGQEEHSGDGQYKLYRVSEKRKNFYKSNVVNWKHIQQFCADESGSGQWYYWGQTEPNVSGKVPSGLPNEGVKYEDLYNPNFACNGNGQEEFVAWWDMHRTIEALERNFETITDLDLYGPADKGTPRNAYIDWAPDYIVEEGGWATKYLDSLTVTEDGEKECGKYYQWRNVMLDCVNFKAHHVYAFLRGVLQLCSGYRGDGSGYGKGLGAYAPQTMAYEPLGSPPYFRGPSCPPGYFPGLILYYEDVSYYTNPCTHWVLGVCHERSQSHADRIMTHHTCIPIKTKGYEQGNFRTQEGWFYGQGSDYKDLNEFSRYTSSGSYTEYGSKSDCFVDGDTCLYRDKGIGTTVGSAPELGSTRNDLDDYGNGRHYVQWGGSGENRATKAFVEPLYGYRDVHFSASNAAEANPNAFEIEAAVCSKFMNIPRSAKLWTDNAYKYFDLSDVRESCAANNSRLKEVVPGLVGSDGQKVRMLEYGDFGISKFLGALSIIGIDYQYDRNTWDLGDNNELLFLYNNPEYQVDNDLTATTYNPALLNTDKWRSNANNSEGGTLCFDAVTSSGDLTRSKGEFSDDSDEWQLRKLFTKSGNYVWTHGMKSGQNSDNGGRPSAEYWEYDKKRISEVIGGTGSGNWDDAKKTDSSIKQEVFPPIIAAYGEVEDSSGKKRPAAYPHRITINNVMDNNIIEEESTQLATRMKFYFWSDHNAMPNRYVYVRWGDGSFVRIGEYPKEDDTEGQLSSFKNRKPVCRELESQPALDVCAKGPSWDDMVPGYACEETADCKHLGSGYTCRTFDSQKHFGNAPQACDEGYFQVDSFYTCSVPSVQYETVCPNQDDLDEQQDDLYNDNGYIEQCHGEIEMDGVMRSYCRFRPSVKVVDNWGWCNERVPVRDLSPGEKNVNRKFANNNSHVSFSGIGGIYDGFGTQNDCGDNRNDSATWFDGYIYIFPPLAEERLESEIEF